MEVMSIRLNDFSIYAQQFVINLRRQKKRKKKKRLYKKTFWASKWNNNVPRH